MKKIFYFFVCALLSLCVANQKTETLEERIKKEEKEAKLMTSDKYAVFVGASSELRHKASISLGYNTLFSEKMNFSRKNIYVLDGDGKKQTEYFVDDRASKKNISMLMKHLEKRIDENDLLLMYITGHGEKTKNAVAIDLDGTRNVDISKEDITEEKFFGYFEKINPRLGILLFDICYGGNFAENFVKKFDKNYITISSGKKDAPSSSDSGDSFGIFFWHAFRNKEESDINKDGKISIKEAIEYAKKHNTYSKKDTFFAPKGEPQVFGLDPEKIFLEE